MSDSTYRATITRVTGEGIFVIIPRLGRGAEYGPCQRVNDNGARTDPAVAGDHGSHSHVLSNLYRPNTQVLVTTVNGIPDDIVVLGPLV